MTTNAHLSALLARAADGDGGAFMEFYDATCDLLWNLELRRYGDARLATEATYARYAAASRRASDHPGSGLSARAWLLSLQLGGRARHRAPRTVMRAS